MELRFELQDVDTGQILDAHTAAMPMPPDGLQYTWRPMSGDSRPDSFRINLSVIPAPGPPIEPESPTS